MSNIYVEDLILKMKHLNKSRDMTRRCFQE